MLKTFWVALGYQCPFQERVLASFSFSLSVSHSFFYRDGGKGDRDTEKDWKEYGYKQAGNKHYLLLKSGMHLQETVNPVMWKPSAADAAALLRYTAHISTGYAQPHHTQLCTSHLTPGVARSFLSPTENCEIFFAHCSKGLTWSIYWLIPKQTLHILISTHLLKLASSSLNMSPTP